MSDNKTYVVEIKDVLNKRTITSFITTDLTQAKMLFAQYMIGEKGYKYNLNIIGEVVKTKKVLLWSGLEAEYYNKKRNCIKKGDENNEQIKIQQSIPNLIGFEKDIKDMSNEEIIKKIFKGKTINV